MQLRAIALVALVGATGATLLRSKQEPDTSCGKGFDNIVDGSKAYFKTAFEKLWSHPSHQMDKSTFKPEFKCWFANMMTQKCGGLPSKAETRKKELAEKCQNPNVQFQ